MLVKLSKTQKTLRLALIAAAAVGGFAAAEAGEAPPLKGLGKLDISGFSVPQLELPGIRK